MGHKGLRVSEADARALAEAYVATMDLKGWRYDFGAVNPGTSEEYAVVFDTYSPAGTLVDGPVVVLISRTTGKARMFEGSM